MGTHSVVPRWQGQSSYWRSSEVSTSNSRARRLGWWLWGVLAIAGLAFGGMPGRASADCTVTPGTVITKANWQQYKDCFTEGEQYLWTGAEFWKMPDDVEIHVGPEHQWTLPKPYVEATEKYGDQTQLGAASRNGI